MNKKVVYSAAIIVAIMLVIFGIQQYQLYQTKKYSPEAMAEYRSSEVIIQITYSRPSKNGRDIFGNLVPFGKWWRTGANEATQITVSNDIVFEENKILNAGKYSIVSIPEKDLWTIIFNNRIPDWGTEYNSEYDALRVIGKVSTLPETVEHFTIDLSESNGRPELIFAWDQTKVVVPFNVL